jgi:hypothetical protein
LCFCLGITAATSNTTTGRHVCTIVAHEISTAAHKHIMAFSAAT